MPRLTTQQIESLFTESLLPEAQLENFHEQLKNFHVQPNSEVVTTILNQRFPTHRFDERGEAYQRLIIADELRNKEYERLNTMAVLEQIADHLHNKLEELSEVKNDKQMQQKAAIQNKNNPTETIKVRTDENIKRDLNYYDELIKQQNIDLRNTEIKMEKIQALYNAIRPPEALLETQKTSSVTPPRPPQEKNPAEETTRQLTKELSTARENTENALGQLVAAKNRLADEQKRQEKTPLDPKTTVDNHIRMTALLREEALATEEAKRCRAIQNIITTEIEIIKLENKNPKTVKKSDLDFAKAELRGFKADLKEATNKLIELEKTSRFDYAPVINRSDVKPPTGPTPPLAPRSSASPDHLPPLVRPPQGGVIPGQNARAPERRNIVGLQEDIPNSRREVQSQFNAAAAGARAVGQAKERPTATADALSLPQLGQPRKM